LPVAQVKKADVRERIFDAARRLFRERGYQKAQIADIAALAGVAPSNIYNYYESKVHLFYEVYTPMLISRLSRLKREVEQRSHPREKVVHILMTLWHDLPEEDNHFSRNLMQAIVTAPEGVEKPHALFEWSEEYLRGLLEESLPEHRRGLMRDSSLPFLLWMAFDGFSVNAKAGEKREMTVVVSRMADLLLGENTAISK